jgi:hypothetical protein
VAGCVGGGVFGWYVFSFFWFFSGWSGLKRKRVGKGCLLFENLLAGE